MRLSEFFIRRGAIYAGLAAVVFMLSGIPAAQAAGESAATPLYHEQYRPQFHFSCRSGWMNDPNGLVFFDGEYHLFFQHNPSLSMSGETSWGSAVSPDLVHWSELPIALAPDERGYVWSGSAVVDWANSSGLGVDGKPPLVAMYTAAKAPFAQCIAFSNDRGRSWTRYADNPVIPHIAAQNRDPHVIWHAATRQWIVVLFKDVDDTFCLYASPDLRHWTHLQDLHVPGCAECPDFFPLAVDGQPSAVKWVFTAANGKYLVGDFDGRQFTPVQDVRQVDFGQNFYAVQTFSDIPPADGRRIQIAWMRDGKYPGMPFNQQMSFPATLTLHQTPDGLRVFRNPVREIERLYGAEHRWSDLSLESGQRRPFEVRGDLFDIDADIDVGHAEEVGLVVRGQPITYHVKEKKLSALGDAPLRLVDGRLQLRLLVDRTSIETFANGGEVSLTSCFLPSADAPPLVAVASGGDARLRSLVVHELKPAWP